MSILYETLWFYLEINAKDHYVLPSALRVMSTRSFLKWAGGKHRVARDLIEIIENDPPHGINWCVQDDESYHEPMLGSGSMYFQLIENKKEYLEMFTDSCNVMLPHLSGTSPLP